MVAIEIEVLKRVTVPGQEVGPDLTIVGEEKLAALVENDGAAVCLLEPARLREKA
jgi:hypothetical protein